MKIILFVLLFAASVVFADDTVWIADPVTKCKVANQSPQPNEVMHWTGPCVNGLATGRGLMTWAANGTLTETYDGDMVNGWAEGEGELRSPKLGYVGHWVHGNFEGKGIVAGIDEENGKWSYEGEIKNGKPNGYGEYVSNGESVKGIWKDGDLVKQDAETKVLSPDEVDVGPTSDDEIIQIK